MPELVLQLLKFLFLIVLYIFVARAVRVVYLELRAAGPQTAPAMPSSPRPASEPRSRRAPSRLAVIEGSRLKGKSFELDDELIIGRDSKCHMVLDDTYVSQVHARIFSKDGAYVVEDLGSTNGTYLNRRRITSPTELQRGDQLKIGKTVLEMRK